MRFSKLWVLAVLPLALAACSSYGTNDSETTGASGDDTTTKEVDPSGEQSGSEGAPDTPQYMDRWQEDDGSFAVGGQKPEITVKGKPVETANSYVVCSTPPVGSELPTYLLHAAVYDSEGTYQAAFKVDTSNGNVISSQALSEDGNYTHDRTSVRPVIRVDGERITLDAPDVPEGSADGASSATQAYTISVECNTNALWEMKGVEPVS